jgi:hypothetical protein
MKWYDNFSFSFMKLEADLTCPPQRDPASVVRFCWTEGGGYSEETVYSGPDHHSAPGG